VSSHHNSLSKPKIAVLGAKGLPFTGGLEIIMEEIGQRFARDGYGFDVFVRKHYMEDKRDLKSYKGIGLRYSWGIHTKHLDAITHSFTALIKVLLGRYDIIYINCIGPSVLGFIPKLWGKKVIVQVHGLDFNRDKWGRIAKAFLRLSALTTVWFADKILFVSEQDKAYFEQQFGVDGIFIPNGVTMKERVPPDLIKRKWGLDKGEYILFMARLVREKGCHLLLEAYQSLETEKVLVIAGDDSHRSAYSEMLKSYAGEHIRFVGFVDGQIKRELLSNAYCYVLPSTLEAMPISLLEAMSFGNCVVASDLPELKSVLESDGILFQTGSVQDLRKKLRFALTNPSFVEEQGKTMIERVKREHDWDKIYRKYRTVVENLIEHA
jgi:glycosyltransferase involved in cell wall biosynthesis